MPIFSATLRHNRRGAIAVHIGRETAKRFLSGARVAVSRKGQRVLVTRNNSVLTLGTCYFSVPGMTWGK